MGQNTSVFKPHDSVTKAQFWVMLSRALWGQTYEGSEPYYLAHLTALQEAWILDDISNPTEQYVTRREVITTLKKSSSVSGIWALSIWNN